MNTFIQKAMSQDMIEKIADAGVIAVIIIDHVKHAIPVAKALMQGGVNAIELTLRTPTALDAAAHIKREIPEMLLGIGTVISTDQVKAIAEIGVDFAVAPGCNPKIIQEAYKQGISFAPGIMTPTDIEVAIDHGCRILKFFPAESSGGMRHLSSISAPYQHLALQFIPLGGCNIHNAQSYLESPLVAAIGGSWLARRSTIQEEDWSTITQNAKEIRALINQINSQMR